MSISEFLWTAAQSIPRKALPLLTFPGAKKLQIRVDELVKDPALYAQTMKLIADETPTVAAVSLMDLSVEAEAFGAEVRFSAEEVPAVVGKVISTLDQAQALAIPSLEEGRLSVCIEGVRLAKEQIQGKPVLAGMIGPYSLAGRLMDVTEIMYYCFDEPDMVHVVLNKVTDFLVRYGNAMKRVGADGIIVAEPLTGILSPDLAREFSMPYVKRVIDALQEENFGIIYHNCGNSVGSMLSDIFNLGATAYHFGNAVDIEAVLQQAPASALCMGNIDPAAEFVQGTPESIAEATKRLVNQCDKHQNFIPSSGCDIPYNADWKNIDAFFSALMNP